MNGDASTKDCPFWAVFVTRSRGRACFHQVLLCLWITRKPWTVTASLLFSLVFKKLTLGFLRSFCDLNCLDPTSFSRYPAACAISDTPYSCISSTRAGKNIGYCHQIYFPASFSRSLPFTLEKWLLTLA